MADSPNESKGPADQPNFEGETAESAPRKPHKGGVLDVWQKVADASHPQIKILVEKAIAATEAATGIELWDTYILFSVSAKLRSLNLKPIVDGNISDKVKSIIFDIIEYEIKKNQDLKDSKTKEHKKFEIIRDISNNNVYLVKPVDYRNSEEREESIPDNDTEISNDGDELKSRLSQMDAYAKEHPELRPSEYVPFFFPEIRQIRLATQTSERQDAAAPDVAPATWATDKQPVDTPPAFIQRHYEPWLGKGLARPDIKRLDPQLYVALSNWLRNNEMPADLDLPTLKEKNDRWVAKIEAEGRPNMGQLPASEASLIRGLISRRRRLDQER